MGIGSDIVQMYVFFVSDAAMPVVAPRTFADFARATV
jgi:hypothetical protein